MVDKNMSDFTECWFAMGVLVLMVMSTNAFLVDLTLVEDAVAKGAVCLDGSPPGYHFSKGFGSGVNNWLVHFEGGSWCNNITTCSARTKTRLGSSKYMSEQVQFSGLLANSKAKNPAPLVSRQRLQKYVYHKISNEIPEGPYCLVYIHTSVQRSENCPGVSTLWLIYEELPPAFKERLQVVYFLHPGLQSRLLFATLGRFFLSAGLYWKLKYINRLEFLWDYIRKGQIEIPDFVYDHDDELEDRPLMDYGVETDPFQVYDMPAIASSDSRYPLRWAS